MKDHEKSREELLIEVAALRAQLREQESLSTEATETLEALTYYRSRYESLAQSGIIGIIEATFDGRITDANEVVLDMLGYSREEVQSGQLRWDTLTPPEYAEIDRRTVRQLQEAGHSPTFEKEYIRKDGVRVPVLLGVSLLDREAGATIGFVLNLTEQKQAEARLQLSEARMRIALRGSPIVVFNQDRHLRYTWIYNPVPGFEMERSIGRTDAELVSHEYAERLEQMKRYVLESGEGTRTEAWLPVGGGERFYDLTLEPLRDAAGEVVGLTGAAVDITEHKMAEAAVRERELRYQLVSRATNDAVWDSNLITGEVEWNEAAFTLFGYAAEAITPSTAWWSEKIHPDDREKVLEEIGRAIESGESAWTQEYRFRRADGSYVLVVDRGYIGYDEAGKPVRMVGSMMDMTERKQTEERLRFLAELSSVLADALDLERTLQSAARLFVPMLADICVIELLQEEYKGRVLAHADPEQEALLNQLSSHFKIPLSVRPPIQKVLESGQPELLTEIPLSAVEAMALSEEHLQRLREIEQRSSLVVPLMGRGRTLGVLVLVSKQPGRYQALDMDLALQAAERIALAIDNTRLYEEAQQAVHVRDQFLAIASHELRTPLTTIKGHTELLLRRAAQEQQADEQSMRGLQTIRQEANRLNRLIDLLLDLSRIQSGQLELDRAVVDLFSLTSRLVENMRPTLEKHSLKLEAEDDSFPVYGDGLRLEQVLHNLLSNAIKYSPAGCPITVKIERQDDRVRVGVTDEGIGIAAAEVPQLFNQFYRANNHVTQGIKGAGLGLYIVRRLVEAHEGKVEVESAPGEGSTFTIDLPALR